MKSVAAEAAVEKPLPLNDDFLARARGALRDYILLTKPRIVLLFGLTGVAAMVMAKADPAYRYQNDRFGFWMVFLGMVLTAGSANAINQYIDRDIDAVMPRTRQKRPIPAGRVKPQNALLFALLIGTLATWLLEHFGSATAAFWGVFTIAFYIGIYTMWLKRMTPYNIVIGGAAGATAPLIGWAAATGQVSLAAWIMFGIIFMWTPPHFWALALCIQDEYAEVSVPMLPVVKGEVHTRRQIFIYTVLLVPLSLALFFTGDCGWTYLIGAAASGAYFLKQAWNVLRSRDYGDKKPSWRMFGTSIAYLFVLFLVMMADAFAFAGDKPAAVAAAAPSAETAAAAAGTPDAKRGQTLTQSKGCVACHTADGTRRVGPSFKGIWGKDEALEGGKTVKVDAAYVIESILEPQAKIVKGYPPSMPSFKGLLSDGEIADIVEFIKSLKK